MGKNPSKKAAFPVNHEKGKRASVPPPNGGKTAVQKVSWENEKPSWRVRNLEMSDPYGWHKVNLDQKKTILRRLGEFETMSWKEILINSKKFFHSVDTERMCPKAQARLLQTAHKDEEDLVSLRLGSRERVWGAFDGRVLDLLWWDPEHEVCPSLKPNT